VRLPLRGKRLPEIIDRAVQLQYTHAETLLALGAFHVCASLPGGSTCPE
jgi:hypothetical protein